MTAVPIDESDDPAHAHGRTTVPPSPGTQPPLMRRINRTIVLVGLMGAGKSCIGKRLAGYLRLPFTDADKEIEAAAGCSIADYFALHGEKAFRDGERRVIQRLLSGPVQVLATGGGAFMDPSTRTLIRERALSIWLRADLELLVKRVARRNERPLLHNVDPREKLSELMALRYPVYAEADLVVDSMDGPPEATLSRVVAALENALSAEAPAKEPANTPANTEANPDDHTQRAAAR
ncbi:MAG TPA: shikimate kinase [Terriglobia bacterium]|nr:shikimate kinase [Terriglobia bacterium]